MADMDTKTRRDLEMADKEKHERDSSSQGELQDSVEVGPDDGSSFDAAIPERKLSWQGAAFLLLSEYIVLAILAFPYTYSILGLAGGTIAVVVVGLSNLYTSHLLWRFCMKHRSIRDLCDAAFILAGRRRWAWYVTFIGFALNNYAIQGLHVVAGSTAIQTIRDGQPVICTLYWSIFMGLVMLLFSILFRDLKHMSIFGLLGSSTMFVCTVIVLAGHGRQGLPNGYTAELGLPEVHVWAPPGTTFVQGVNALLNAVYTFVGQALVPSFVGDMEHPKDFPKALYISMTCQMVLYVVVGAFVYKHTGTQYTTAPAYGSLIRKYGRVAAGFTMPTIIIVGVLYSLITSRAILFQIFPAGSRHRLQHTVKGWATWTAIVVVGWIISYIIGEAVPFFSDLLSLISSLFDSWFGYIYWSAGWFLLYRGRYFQHTRRSVEFFLSAIMIITGLFFFGAGTYASIQSILNSYATGNIKKPFACTNSGFTFTR